MTFVWPSVQLRLRSLTRHPLFRAFALSLAIHLALFSTIETLSRYHLLDRLPLPAWMRLAANKITVAATAKNHPKPAPKPNPTIFVEVLPQQSIPKAPRNAKYYAAHNSQAANPSVTKITGIPNVSGHQTEVPKTFNTPRVVSPPKPLPRPAPKPLPRHAPQPHPKAPAKRPAVERLAPHPLATPGKTTPQPGNLAFSTPLTPPPFQGRTRPGQSLAAPDAQRILHQPSALAEARLRQGLIHGKKMRQHGGVRRHNVLSSVNAVGTTIGAYDNQLIAAVQNRWDDILDERNYAGDARGKVVLHFRLHDDGTLSNMRIVRSDVGDLLAYYCQLAVEDPAPYAPWPEKMRRTIGNNYRELEFIFNYQ